MAPALVLDGKVHGHVRAAEIAGFIAGAKVPKGAAA